MQHEVKVGLLGADDPLHLCSLLVGVPDLQPARTTRTHTAHQAIQERLEERRGHVHQSAFGARQMDGRVGAHRADEDDEHAA